MLPCAFIIVSFHSLFCGCFLDDRTSHRCCLQTGQFLREFVWKMRLGLENGYNVAICKDRHIPSSHSHLDFDEFGTGRQFIRDTSPANLIHPVKVGEGFIYIFIFYRCLAPWHLLIHSVTLWSSPVTLEIVRIMIILCWGGLRCLERCHVAQVRLLACTYQ